MTAVVANEVLSLPVTPEAIDARWLSEALSRRYPGVVVTAAKVRDVMTGTSTKIRVELRYNRAGQECGLPPTLIVKGGFEEHSPSMAFMYESEMRFYRDVLPVLDINAPTCHFAASDPASHQSIVILEDLAAKNVTFCRAQRTFGYQQEAAFLDAMARYHAQWWDRPALKAEGELGWVGEPFDYWSTVYQQRYLKPEVWAHYMALPRGAAASTVLHDRQRMEQALQGLAEYHWGSPLTLVHGDTHLGNLYIEADGKPGFLDAQVRRSPWYQDVAYHMTAALDIVDRREWEQALLSFYLQRLSRYGVATPPSFDDAWEAYRREIAYGLFIFLINETRFQTEATNTAYAARFAAAAIDHDTFGLLLDRQ